ncbi:hypothetical protein Tsubulata_000040 [Turnera subulata]|uniref:SET domain-containing protein n=1 Tax=Turnera subulata TaxID=218843 RepID=A0A9Q0FL90_9ROSI|nr:hypothetical protein Tsubulata_000040 [Turnera subulata]
MEKLKCLIPDSLKRVVADSNPNDLPSTSSSLLDFLHNLPQFQQVRVLVVASCSLLMIRDLVDTQAALCGKNKEAALESKQKGNKCYTSGDYNAALAHYSQALWVAPTDAVDTDKNLVASLYLNRASLFYKIGLLKECLRECNRALQISPTYAKAWYRRGKANAALRSYKDAVNDLNIAKNLELSLGGKRQIESEIKIIEDSYEDTSRTVAEHKDNYLGNFEESQQKKLVCVSTPDKGMGMISQSKIPEATLVHREEPYAMIILKSCRETHCHYCLNELPADAIPCTSCTIPLYCSEHCRLRAGGEEFCSYQKEDKNLGGLSLNLEEYIAEVTVCHGSGADAECFLEHKHECRGVNWPAVLPPDVVLTGRVLVKSISQKRDSADLSLLSSLKLSHNYSQITAESKLELHIFAVVLLLCLQQSFRLELPINGDSLSQTILLLCKMRINCMAIVRMKTVDAHGLPNWLGKSSSIEDALTSSVEQVPVAQAIYSAGSLFNHSCKPNIHAYFLSRTLVIRTTEPVAAGHPLELSYGAQVGQWDCKDRLKFLEDKYSFRCQCRGCSEWNLPDLVLNAFHCVSLNCAGVVLDADVINCEMHKFKDFAGAPTTQNVDHPLLGDELNDVDILNFAKLALERGNNSLDFHPGHCLSCGSHCNLEASSQAMNKAWICIKKLQDEMILKEISNLTLSNASRAVDVLRSILHPYSRRIAEAEDILAQAFCLVGDLQSARDHCKASIKILERLYGRDHIVIAYELVKLSTIELTLDDHASVDCINRLNAIFLRYFGSHAASIFPYLEDLKRRARNLV